MSLMPFSSKASVVLGIFLLLIFLIAIYLIIKPEHSNNLQNNDGANENQLSPTAETELQKQIAPLIAAGDIQACDAVSDESYKLVCQNNIVLNQAKKTGDVSLCQQIDNVMVPRSFCESQIVLEKSVNTNDIQVCMEAQDTAVQKSCTAAFNQRVAFIENNMSQCDGAVDTTSCRANLMFVSLVQTPRETNCSQLSTSEEQAECETLKEELIKETYDQQSIAMVCSRFKTTFIKNVCNAMNSTASESQELAR